MNPQEAQRIIADMDSGKIQWDDNLRARANKIISPPTQQVAPPPVPQATPAPVPAPASQSRAPLTVGTGYTGAGLFGQAAPFQLPPTRPTNPQQLGSFNPQTGQVGPFIPEGIGYQPPPSATTAFPDTSALPMQGEMIGKTSLESGFPDVAPLTFDFGAEQRKAYEALRPFYSKLLSFAGGKLDLAKRILGYTYDQGMRESEQEFEESARSEALTIPEERETLVGQQHRRGVLESGFGETQRGRLEERQNLRREAIQRALESRESRLGADLGFGKEKGEREFQEEQFGLERERRQEAGDVAGKRFGIKRDIFSSQLAQAGREESRRTADELRKAQEKALTPTV